MKGSGEDGGPEDGVIDPDVDLHVPAQRAETAGAHAVVVLAAVAAGGALGACARYALTLPWPAAPGGFPWAVLAVNAAGCALIGVLMTLLEEHGGKRSGGAWARHPLARPFLGTGVLGGFTTFSVYALDAVRLLEEGAAGTALLYLGATVAAALCAVWAATAATRAATTRAAVAR